ncbi:myoD family inhibitor domain-containing protein isoform 1-T2 [Synchiropus picturatus]
MSSEAPDPPADAGQRGDPRPETPLLPDDVRDNGPSGKTLSPQSPATDGPSHVTKEKLNNCNPVRTQPHRISHSTDQEHPANDQNGIHLKSPVSSGMSSSNGTNPAIGATGATCTCQCGASSVPIADLKVPATVEQPKKHPSTPVSQRMQRKLRSSLSVNSDSSRRSKGSSTGSQKPPLPEDCCVHCILACLFCEFLALCNMVVTQASCGTCTPEACCCCCSEEVGDDCNCPCDMDCGIMDACCESSDCLEICMECCGICFPT